MNVNYIVATLALVAGGAALGTYLVPRGGELAMIYYRSGRYEDARRVLEHEMRVNELAPSNVYYASQTYLRLGEIDRTIDLVARFVEANPKDLTARRKLAELYLDSGRLALYIRTLEAMEKLGPAKERRLELLKLYRTHGYYPQWLAMLERVVHENIGSKEDHIALATYRASRDDRAGAMAVLALLIERFPDRVTISADEVRLNIQLDAARDDLALAIAKEAFARVPTVATALTLADLFQRRGRPALALQALELVVQHVADNAALMRMLVSLEIAQGRGARAFDRLQALDRAGKLLAADRNYLVTAAVAAGNWDAAKAAFARVDTAELWRSVLEMMAREAVARTDRAAMRAIADRVTPEFRTEYPVTAAELALALDDKQEARRWADEAFRRTGLAGTERIGLAQVYIKLDAPDRAKTLLASLSQEDGVSEDIAIELAALFAKLGLASDGLALFERLAKTSKAPRVLAARTLLAARVRPEVREWDLAWSDAAPGGATRIGDVMISAYYVAMDMESYALAATLAKKLLAAAPSEEARIRYARALALDGRAEAAIAIVRPLLKTSADARAIYTLALIASVKAGKASDEETRAFLADQLRDPALSRAEKKALVDDLLYVKAYGIVVPVLEQLIRAGSGDYADLYIAALAAIRDKKQLRAMIERELKGEGDLIRLRGLANVAFQESVFDLARVAYLRILKAEPKNAEVIKRLGLMAYWGGDNGSARRYLEQYLATGADDYHADFTLGEIITQFPDWERATPYYRRALERITRVAQPTFEDRVMRAKLLYRLARFDDAIAAYETLLRQFPRERDLREQYADVLDEIGRYDRARELRPRVRER